MVYYAASYLSGRNKRLLDLSIYHISVFISTVSTFVIKIRRKVKFNIGIMRFNIRCQKHEVVELVETKYCRWVTLHGVHAHDILRYYVDVHV